MKNSISVATKNTKKATKKQVLAILENAKDSLVVSLPENVDGEKIKKARQLGAVMLEKISANNTEKEKRASLTYNLNALKGNAEKYVQLLAIEHNIDITIEKLVSTLKTPKVFLAYLSEKQRVKFENKALKFNYWLILTLVSKYIKAQK